MTLEVLAPCAVPGYLVSSQGRIISIKYGRHRPLAPQRDRDGYLRVHLSEGKVARWYPVHRLVALAFCGEPKPGEAVAHGNGISDDNRAENLRWATQAENCADKAKHGTEQKGSKHPRASTDEAAIARVKSAFREGLGIRRAAARGPVSYSVAFSVKHGKTWRHVA